MQKEWDRNDADRHPKTPKHHFHDIPPNREIHFVFEIEYSVTVSNEIDGNSDNHRIDGTATELEQYIYNRNIHNYHRRNGKLILAILPIVSDDTQRLPDNASISRKMR